MRNRLVSALLTSAALVTVTACAGSLEQKPPPPTPTPSSSASSSPHPSSGVSIPPEWLSFSWPEAGFSVKLPSKATKATIARDVRGIPIVLRLAVIRDTPGPIEVGVSQLGVRLTKTQIGAELQSSVKSLAKSSGSVVTSQKPARFRGMRALKAILTRGTQNFQLLVFQRDPSHEVFVFAAEGAVFEAVSSSLRLH